MKPLRRILLVEDDPMEVELALLILQEAGLREYIDVVSDGVQALDYLYRRGPFADRPRSPVGLVLLDLKLPRLDGFEVLQQVKADPELRRVPVVILSSSTHDLDIQCAYELGANAYVPKGGEFESHSRQLRETARFWLESARTAPAAP